jgi:hypothetical protein
MTDIKLRKKCAKLEAKTNSVLVLGTFQSDEDKHVGDTGVCRALASLWIHAGIEGSQTHAITTFMQIAPLDSAATVGAVRMLHEQQTQAQKLAYNKMWDAIGAKLAKFKGVFGNLVLLQKNKDKLDLESAGTLNELREKFKSLATLPVEYTNFANQAYADMLGCTMSIGATDSGHDLCGWTPATASTPVLVAEWLAAPKALVAKTGFYYLGLSGLHATSLYYDGATSYFYDANTGLWRVPGGKEGFKTFVQTYFKSVYDTHYDHVTLMLLLMEKPLHGETKRAVEHLGSVLDAYRDDDKHTAH